MQNVEPTYKICLNTVLLYVTRKFDLLVTVWIP